MSGSSEVQYGLTPQGFVRMRLPEITKMIQDRIEIETGEKWNWNEDSFIGLLVSIFGDEIAKMWELMEAVHLSMYPRSAKGAALDKAITFSGARRRFDTPTQVLALMYGLPGTTVPGGSQARTSSADGLARRTYTLQEQVTISPSAAAFAAYDLASMPAGYLHFLSVNGVSYSWLALNTNAADAALGLGNVLNSAGIKTVVSNSRLSVTAPLGTGYGLVPSSSLSLVSLASVGLFAADALGPFPIKALELTEVVSDVAGWTRVSNPEDGQTGALAEQDNEVVARYDRGVYRFGGGSVPAILANLEKNVLDVEQVQVYENDRDVADDQGRLPHSIEVVIEGGLDSEIAKEIMRVKGGGIATNGSTVVQVRDSAGVMKPIRFNRPARVYIWMIIDVTSYEEETLSPDAEIRIREKVIERVNGLATGKDFLARRIEGAVFDATPGLKKVAVRAAAIPTANLEPPSGSYLPNDIVITPRQRAYTGDALIQVNIL